MSEIITGVVKLTFGFLSNKIRDGIAEGLKDGDVTDEECRSLIVRELDDIKSKLNGLARKDLLSSFLFLQEGVNRLFHSLLQVDSNENIAESPDQGTSLDTASFTGTGSDSPINEAITLINAMASLKIRSYDLLKSAIESFKLELAREEDTKAFANEALSIEDRIQASQVRIIARILENLECPEASASDCLQYLKQLHDIGSIREIFSALTYGGMKSMFNKTKRLNNAASVQIMNQILFEFIKKFTKSSWLARMSVWPAISLGGKNYHPLVGEDRLSEKLDSSGVQVMSLNSNFTFGEKIFSATFSVLNSKGDIIALTRDQRTFKVFKRSGERYILYEFPEKHPSSARYSRTMDIDGKNNLYVVAVLGSTFYGATDENISRNLKLFVFDENGNEKLESLLPFRATSLSTVRMAINKEGEKIAILNRHDKNLYIGNVCVELNSLNFAKIVSLELEYDINIVRFSSFDGTIVVATFNTVSIYTENGELQRTIEKPTGHETIQSVAINHPRKRILVKTYQPSGISLLSFSETGELQDSLYLESLECPNYGKLISHPNGPVALVRKTGATLFQL